MSIRTTVTLDDDVIVRVKEEAAKKGVAFREALNGLIRRGLMTNEVESKPRKLSEETINFELPPGLSVDNISELLDVLEGEDRR
jgi:hypothetical protein